MSPTISALAPVGTTTASATTAPAVTTQGSGAADPLANESTFLTLLVSQLQNQDPLNPVDSTQFVSQLTSFSQLEQLVGIHADTTSASQSLEQANKNLQVTTASAASGQAATTNGAQ